MFAWIFLSGSVGLDCIPEQASEALLGDISIKQPRPGVYFGNSSQLRSQILLRRLLRCSFTRTSVTNASVPPVVPLNQVKLGKLVAFI